MDGGKKTCGVPPLPRKVMVCCGIAALSEMVMVPETGSVVVGVKVRFMEQVAPGAMEPQACPVVTSEGDEVPLEICRAAFPQLVTVKFWVVGVFTRIEPKSIRLELRQTDGAATVRSSLVMKLFRKFPPAAA